jgi:hypothetical protein
MLGVEPDRQKKGAEWGPRTIFATNSSAALIWAF